MTRLSLAALAVLLFASPMAFAQGSQYQAENGPFVLTDCRIETITNGVIANGSVAIGADGRIAGVGTTVTAPAGATSISCNGGTVYPGFIDGGTRLGLVEINSVPETQDVDEVGDIHPQMQALTAVNPSSASIPVTRVSGVTNVLSVPAGGMMPGTAALIHLHGYTPEQMAAGFAGVVVEFPRSGRRGRFDRRTKEAIEKATKESMEKLDAIWDEAVLYARIDSARTAQRSTEALPYQPEAAALLPVMRGDMPLLVEVNGAADIQKAIEWLDGKNVQAILTGVAEGWRVADEIVSAGLPVITGPVTALPTRQSDRYDRPYTNAALMARDGVQVALRTSETENVRNLTFQAGFAVAHGQDFGFTRQNALEAITITPARMFGLADDLGSIEVGKLANLFVSSGDPFEPATQITDLYIGGRRIPMVSRHTELYDEYLNRSPGLTTSSGE
ncbi:MAG: amidohydrolase family protein [Rubricoccaceae bacterium]